MTSLSLGFDHLQQQKLSPRLQRAVRLLQLSSLDFAREVRDALEKNPFLENDENESGNDAELDELISRDGILEGCGSFAGEHTVSEPSVDEPVAAEVTALPGAAESALDDERENWQTDGLYSARANDDGDASWIEFRATEASLTDVLSRQLGLLPLSPRDRTVAEAVIGSLDDDGYLRVELSEIAPIVRLDPEVSSEELGMALSLVQSLEPAGVGARTLQECLRRQLFLIECQDSRELAERIIEHHLDALAAKDVSGLASELGRSVSTIQDVLAEIRRLDPRPGIRYDASHVPYIIPDVIVRKIRGHWTAMLNSVVIPRVRLNRVYAEMFQRTRCAQHGELATHLQEARWTVSNVEQRFATILSVAQAIVARQRNFFEYGPLAMKPLGLREIADEVGVHESTVSRVTNNKFMSTPLGVFELKYFFSRAMVTASGGECSATAIRGVIKDMIEDETPEAPLSDAEIARLLARQGLVVARRTVTKYRQAMRIEAYERRRLASA